MNGFALQPAKQNAVSLLDPEAVRYDEAARSEAFFCRHLPVKVGWALYDELKAYAAHNDHGDVRLCLHPAPDAGHHDMILLLHHGNYYRPHKHMARGEAFQMIEGRLGVLSFSDTGAIEDATVLEPGEIYRVDAGAYHGILPLSDIVLFHENKPGPFRGPSDNIMAEWSPDMDDEKATDAYRRRLENLIDQLSGAGSWT